VKKIIALILSLAACAPVGAMEVSLQEGSSSGANNLPSLPKIGQMMLDHTQPISSRDTSYDWEWKDAAPFFREQFQQGKPVDVQQDKNGKTALYHAAQAGALKVCESLLGCGAEVDTQDKDGMSPLYQAAFKDHGAVCELLLACGASTTRKTRYQSTRQSRRIPNYERKQSNTGRTLLQIAKPNAREVIKAHLARYSPTRTINELFEHISYWVRKGLLKAGLIEDIITYEILGYMKHPGILPLPVSTLEFREIISSMKKVNEKTGQSKSEAGKENILFFADAFQNDPDASPPDSPNTKWRFFVSTGF